MSQEVKGFRPGSESWKKFMGKLYGLGGAVVIIGALFKIQHYPGASIMLIVGLTTEAVIFIFSAFEPLHEDPNWALVYPELAEHHDEEEETEGEEGEELEIEEHRSDDSDLPITEQLDNMLEEAKIGPELIESLGAGLRTLSDNATKLSDISDASVATNEYVDSVKNASTNVNQLSDNYAKASESLASISISSEDGSDYAAGLKSVSSKLAELSGVYDAQLQGSREQMESTKQFYGGISELMANLQASVEDTKQYKENISELSSNLSQLNRIYGNMLQAMNAGMGNNNNNG